MLKDESYKLMGLLFEVHNELGTVYKEKNYQDAIEAMLKRESIPYEREKRIDVKIGDTKVSDIFADFVIDNKILLEIKATKFITQEDIRQTLKYIKSSNIPLGIIVNFRKEKLEYKRLVNPAFESDSSLFEQNSSDATLGTKVEVKNLNSFKVVGKAIEYEIKRQIKALEAGESLVQETRGWDEAKGATFSQRKKESSDDYRYFPDPDLPKLKISEIAEFQNLELPELPWEKRGRYEKDYGIKAEDTESFVVDAELGAFFEEVIKQLRERSDLVVGGSKRSDLEEQFHDTIKLASNYVTSDLIGLQQNTNFSIYENLKPEAFAELIQMVGAGELSSRGAKDILKVLTEQGGAPRQIAEEKGLFQKSDEGELKQVVEKIIAENDAVVAEYKAGKEASLQFLIGQGMRATKGSANPGVLKKLFEESLK